MAENSKNKLMELTTVESSKVDWELVKFDWSNPKCIILTHDIFRNLYEIDSKRKMRFLSVSERNITYKGITVIRTLDIPEGTVKIF